MKILKITIFFIFFILLSLNFVFYLNTINLAQELYQLENDLEKLDIENKKLEKDISLIDNVNYLSSQAANLGLIYPLKYWYLESNKYALQNKK